MPGHPARNPTGRATMDSEDFLWWLFIVASVVVVILLIVTAGRA
jgi:hypothetical protein